MTFQKRKKKSIDGYPYVQYRIKTLTKKGMLKQTEIFFEWMDQRRTVRDFSDKAIPRAVIENIIKSASTAPSGAHKQPWTFCVVSDPKIKEQIKVEAEREEFESYNNRMSEDWLKDLAPLGTDWHKPFLEIAPYLIVVFKRVYEFGEGNEKKNNYYVNESLGLACGFLLTAIHDAGLVALTHTPSPMNFLSKVLNRPENERPFLLIPVGYPAKKVFVPDIKRKGLEEIVVWY